MEGNADTTAQRQAALIFRVAWVLTFVVPLVLAALLLGVKSAQAAPAGPERILLAFEETYEGLDELEEGEEELELEACEIAEEELEEGELSEADAEEICEETEGEGKRRAAGSSATAPEECLLRSAHAHAVVSPQHHSVKLTVGYTTYEPVGATVEIGKGAARIGAVHRHLGRSGVLRIVKSLGKDQAPRQTVVQIAVSGSPRYCAKYETEKIRIHQAGR